MGRGRGARFTDLNALPQRPLPPDGLAGGLSRWARRNAACAVRALLLRAAVLMDFQENVLHELRADLRAKAQIMGWQAPGAMGSYRWRGRGSQVR